MVAKQLLSTYEDMAELIRLGAYKRGTDPDVDAALFYFPLLEKFLSQQKVENTSMEECYAELTRILSIEPTSEADGQVE